MTRLIFLICISITSLSQAAEVLKISKSRVNIVISDDVGQPWEVGKTICVQSKKGASYCGQITKVMSRGAICKMRSPVEGVVPGDEVTLEVSSESLDSALGAEKSDLEEGKLEGSREERASEQEQKKSRKKRKFAFGFRGGPVLANVSTDSNAAINKRTAINFGLIFDIPLGLGMVSLEPGLAFVQKGYETSSVAFGFNYIEIPLLLKVRLLAGRVTPTVFLGPYSSFLVSAKTNSIAGEQSVKELYKTIDFGATGGLGCEFKVAPKMDFGLVGGYSLSFSDIKKVASSEKTKHKLIQVLLYVAFQ